MIEGRPIVKLLDCTVHVEELAFSPQEREYYIQIEKESQNQVKRMIESDSIQKSWGLLLVMMTRLRQMCDHSDLIPPSYLEKLKQPEIQNKEHLMEVLNAGLDQGEECPICYEVMEPQGVHQIVISTCMHLFCEMCIVHHLQGHDQCPLCRQKISRSTLLNYFPMDKHKLGKTVGKTSTKILKLIQILKATPSTIKSVVFSQWTSMLDIVQVELEKAGIAFSQYDGSLSRKKRDGVLCDFKHPSGPSVLLMSLKCGSVGLNITEASQVFLLDPWWNTAIENQAIDRVYRIGQTKPVNVWKFVMKGTIEDRVRSIQDEKDRLIQKAFALIDGANERVTKEERIRDIAALFGFMLDA